MLQVIHRRSLHSILLSFNMQKILQNKNYNIDESEQEIYIVQMRSQIKTRGEILPKVHGTD